MDLLLDDFKKDLARLKKLQSLITLLNGFRAHQKPAAGGTPFLDHAMQLHDAVAECHADLVVLSGAMILYLAGRFEFYVKERFEQACDAIANKTGSLDQLPKPMKEMLIARTAEVMANPRKFGHADKNVETFVKNLATNMAAAGGLGQVNSRCLSITMENMRPAIVTDLFARIGFKELWQMAAEQASIKKHLGEMKTHEARASCTKYLDEFMDVRNKIAHPSANFAWPSLVQVGEAITYFEVLAATISDSVEVYELSIPNTIPPPAQPPLAEPAADSAAVAPAPAVAEAPQILEVLEVGVVVAQAAEKQDDENSAVEGGPDQSAAMSGDCAAGEGAST